MSHRILRSEQDYLSAIERLNTSTKAFTLRTETVLAQQELAETIQHSPSSKSAHAASVLSQKALAEAQYAKAVNDRTTTDLSDSLSARATFLDKLVNLAPTVVGEQLRIHDRIIEQLESTRLNALANTIEPESDEPRIELLAKSLTKTKTAALRYRLDRVFLEALAESPEPDAEPADRAAMAVLEQDIQSLYVELDDVMSMLVNHQYLLPLQTAIKDANASRARLRNHNLKYALTELEALSLQSAELAQKIKATMSSRILLQHLRHHLDQIEMPSRALAVSNVLSVPARNSAMDRLFEHIGTAEDVDGNSHGFQTILSKCEEASSTRSMAIDDLLSVPDLSASTCASLHELEGRIGEARHELDRQSRAS